MKPTLPFPWPSNRPKRHLGWLLLLLGVLLPTWVTPVRAERVRVTVPEENFRSSPNGKILAVVKEGTELLVVGQRGRWLQVRLGGWLWRPRSEAAKKSAADAQKALDEAQSAPPPPVELLAPTLTWHPQDYHRKQGPQRAHLEVRLQFQNHTEHTLGAVNYRLRLLNPSGRELLAEDFDSDVLVPPKDETPATVTHRWLERGGPSGETYRLLRQAAERGALDAEVTLNSAYFFEVGQKPLRVNSP